MPTRIYRGYDHIFASDFPVPGALEVEGGACVDFEIVEGEASLDGEGAELYPYKYRDGRLLFSPPGPARYRCDDGRRIVVECKGGAEGAAGLLVATALPALLWMRGELVLHAAGVALDGGPGAIAVCGPSGSGKSTVLRDLIARGAHVVGDDTLRVSEREGAPWVSGLPGCYFEGAHDARTIRDVKPGTTRSSAPLTAIVVLDPQRAPGESRFRALNGIEALEAILNNVHRPRIPRLIGKQKPLLDVCVRLASLGVFAWRRPPGALSLSPDELEFLSQRCHGANHSVQQA